MKPMMIEANRLDLMPFEAAQPAIFGTTAVIPVIGYLSRSPSVFNFFSTTYDEIADGILSAIDNSKVERIILDVNSPGGDISGLFELCDTIKEASAEKPIEAIANDDAFSAAYAIASSAQKVWVTRTGGVGSIGVIATHVDQSEYDKKKGFRITPIFAGSYKNDLSPHEPISEHALEMMQGEIVRLYDLLVETVASNRGLGVQAVRDTQAALYFGESAVTEGLADGLITLRSLINQWGKENQEKPSRCVSSTRSVFLSTIGEDMGKENQVEPAENEATPEPIPANNNATQPEPDLPTAATSAVMELVELSKIARRPELLGCWLEKGMTVAQAKTALLSEMEQSPETITARAPVAAKLAENPLLQAAKARAEVAAKTRVRV
jgi:signal peptide peptidase SppA